jgi:hypothetical protein
MPIELRAPMPFSEPKTGEQLAASVDYRRMARRIGRAIDHAEDFHERFTRSRLPMERKVARMARPVTRRCCPRDVQLVAQPAGDQRAVGFERSDRKQRRGCR